MVELRLFFGFCHLNTIPVALPSRDQNIHSVEPGSKIVSFVDVFAFRKTGTLGLTLVEQLFGTLKLRICI